MSAVFHGLNGFIDRAVGRHENHRNIVVCTLSRAQNVYAGSIRHPQIREYDFMRSAGNLVHCFARISSFSDRVAGVLERQAQHPAQAFFIFYQENVRHAKVAVSS